MLILLGCFLIYQIDKLSFSFLIFQDGRRQLAVEAQGVAAPAVAGPPVLPALGNRTNHCINFGFFLSFYFFSFLHL